MTDLFDHSCSDAVIISDALSEGEGRGGKRCCLSYVCINKRHTVPHIIPPSCVLCTAYRQCVKQKRMKRVEEEEEEEEEEEGLKSKSPLPKKGREEEEE